MTIAHVPTPVNVAALCAREIQASNVPDVSIVSSDLCTVVCSYIVNTESPPSHLDCAQVSPEGFRNTH